MPKIGDKFDPTNPDHAGTPPVTSAPDPLPGAAGPDVPPAAPTSTAGAEEPPAAKAGPARARAKRAPKRDAAPKPGPGRPSNKAKRAEKVGGMLATVGMCVMPFQPADGVAVMQHSPAIADAVAELAEQNKRIASFIDSATTNAAWVGVGIAVLPLVVQILANHELIPAELGALVAGAQGAAQGNPMAPPSPDLTGAAAA